MQKKRNCTLITCRVTKGLEPIPENTLDWVLTHNRPQADMHSVTPCGQFWDTKECDPA